MCYRPDGTIDSEINIAVSQPSCVAFGGETINLLFVTTARTDLTEEVLVKVPATGNVFIFETNLTGFPEARYKKLDKQVEKL